MAKSLTVKSVEQIKPTDKRQEIPDKLQTGLYLIVQPESTKSINSKSKVSKSWAVRYRYGNRTRKLTLGPYPTLGLADARKEAKGALQIVAKNGDPASQKRIAKLNAAEGRDLFENIVAEYLKRHTKKRDGTPIRTLAERERMFNHDVLPHWRGRRIQDITKRDLIELTDKMVDRGIGVTTNHVFNAVRGLFSWVASRDDDFHSPFVGMKKPVTEASRDRVLTDEEIQWFWQATDAQGYPFGPLFQLLLVTGQRLSEVAKMPWTELDMDKHLWSLPTSRTKNGRPHDVHLSDLARATIGYLPKIACTRELVFTTTGNSPVSGFSRAKRNLDRMIADIGRGEIAHWTLHDLRRTVTTGMQRLAIPPHITEAVLNHKSGVISGVAAVYARHNYADEKRAALNAWTNFLVAIVEGRASEFLSKKTKNVVPFRSAKVSR